MRHSSFEIRKNVFSQRIVQDWNSLSESIAATITLNVFKSRRDKQWQAVRYVASEAEESEYKIRPALYSVFCYPDNPVSSVNNVNKREPMPIILSSA